MKTIEETLNYIHSVCWQGSRPGLSRTVELLGRLGNPQDTLKYVHIAGTNGKGSTASMLASILRTAGYRTGLYTSPYITCFNERMQVDGEMISDEELIEVTTKIQPLADTMEDLPTEFELVTAIAMEYFARHKCDIVVLEVGLGGELDSTNVIHQPEAAVITNIGLDHVEVLGDTLEKIAQAKAGIIKGGEVAIYRGAPEVEAVFEAACARTGARLHRAQFDTIRLVSEDLAGQVFDCAGFEGLKLPLMGEHQRKNAAVVLATVEALRARGWNITDGQIRLGLENTSWPGRFELLSKDPIFVVDGGHNPQCMESLANNLAAYLPGKDLTALTGVMADKDFLDMYELVDPYVSRYVAVTPDNPRALPAQKLAQTLAAFGKPVVAYEDVAEGVRAALAQIPEGGAGVAFGSLYMLGVVRETVAKETKK